MAALRSAKQASMLWKFGRSGLLDIPSLFMRDRTEKCFLPSCTKLVTRSFKGSNRDTKRRERNEALRLKRQAPGPLTEFDRKAFIFQNFHQELFAFQKRLSIEFDNQDYLKAAFVHPSFLDRVNNSKSIADFPSFVEGNMDLVTEYQNLGISTEKLSLLGFVHTTKMVTSNLFSCYPQFSPFLLQEFANVLTSRKIIANLSKNLGIPDLIVIDHDLNEIDNEKHLPFSKDDVLCDTFFAIMGAIYRDLGSDEVQKFVDDFIMPIIDDESFRENIKLKNPVKTTEEIAALAGHEMKPEPRLIFSAGKNTTVPLYIVGVFSGDKQLGEGASYTLKLAEKAAFETSVYNAMWRKEKNLEIENS